MEVRLTAAMPGISASQAAAPRATPKELAFGDVLRGWHACRLGMTSRAYCKGSLDSVANAGTLAFQNGLLKIRICITLLLCRQRLHRLTFGEAPS